MGVLAGYLLVITPILVVLFLVYKAATPNRGEKKSVKAGKTLYSQVSDTMYRYSGQLDIVGQAMADEIRTNLNAYRKEIDK